MKKSLGGGLGFPFLLNWPQTEFSLFLLEKGERNVTLRVCVCVVSLRVCVWGEACLWMSVGVIL